MLTSSQSDWGWKQSPSPRLQDQWSLPNAGWSFCLGHFAPEKLGPDKAGDVTNTSWRVSWDVTGVVLPTGLLYGYMGHL